MVKNMSLLSYANSSHFREIMCSNHGILFNLFFSYFRHHPKGLSLVTVFFPRRCRLAFGCSFFENSGVFLQVVKFVCISDCAI